MGKDTSHLLHLKLKYVHSFINFKLDKICSPELLCAFLVISHGEVNCIGGVIVTVLASSAVYCAFEPRSGQTKDHQIVICFFSTKHVTLRRKSKEWLAQNQNNVSK